MKKALRILSLLLVLTLTLFAFAACGESAEEEGTGEPITITVQVVNEQGETKDFVITTSEKYLRGALEQENLVEGEDGAYGLYIKKVNGILADYEVNGAYWSVYEGETMAMTGVEKIRLKDGGVYKLVYTKE